MVVFGSNGWIIKQNTGKKVSGLGPTKSIKKESVEPGEPLKVGDMVYVLYTETEGGEPIISKPGKIGQKMKSYKWKVYWDDWKGGPYWKKYNFGEVYKKKKEAEYARKYWYIS